MCMALYLPSHDEVHMLQVMALPSVSPFLWSNIQDIAEYLDATYSSICCVQYIHLLQLSTFTEPASESEDVSTVPYCVEGDSE